ncbi:hypothetical protein V8B55DRAFT_1558475 [Mucor lusitanicus]|uniref:Uncharacterized protein n=1 Tax=Mucor lusitanicus CBS 277.49 TaxID=747725 RepID=A0A168JZW1_MUCCL|nr:hypothetical protein MUCCIDRAFT_111157 [Mucor lusitanicus CBS 277.49]
MVQANAKQKLMIFSMGSNKSITKPSFANLRRTLNVFNSLNNGASASLEPISDTIVKIKSIYTLFEKQRSWDRLPDAFTPPKQTGRKFYREREHKPYDRNEPKRAEKASRPYCSYKDSTRRNHDRFSRDSKQTKSDTDMEEASSSDSDQDQNLSFKAANLHLQSSKGSGAPQFFPCTNIKLWAFLYLGCSFSAISPRSAQHLNVAINEKSGLIKLAPEI